MYFKWNSLIALIATAGLQANVSNGQNQACEPAPKVCCEPAQPGPFGFAFPMDLGLNCPQDFYFHADALAFQAKQDGMDFVIHDSNGTTPPITQGKVDGFSNSHTDWDWNPGMRLGIGFFLKHDRWNLDFNWTWVNITDYKHSSMTTSGGVLIPLWLTGANTPAAELGVASSAVWDASYNTIDAQIGKPFYISRALAVNPHFGVRGAVIDQHFSVDYSGEDARVIHHGDNNFWGVGARLGVDVDFKLGKGWCLFGNFAAAMLFGQFDVDQDLTYGPTVSSDGFNLEYDFFQNVPNTELALGLGWGQYVNKKKQYISLRAAYEFHEWWDQLNMRRFWSGSPAYVNDVVSRGNLTLNGFSLKLQINM